MLHCPSHHVMVTTTIGLRINHAFNCFSILTSHSTCTMMMAGYALTKIRDGLSFSTTTSPKTNWLSPRDCDLLLGVVCDTAGNVVSM